MILDTTEKDSLKFAVKLWAARNLGAAPYLIRKGGVYVPDSWEMQECCAKFIEQPDSRLIQEHCMEPLHIANLCQVKENDLLHEIDKLTRKEK